MPAVLFVLCPVCVFGPLFLSLAVEHGVSWQNLCCFWDCLAFINNSSGHDDGDQHPNREYPRGQESQYN